MQFGEGVAVWVRLLHTLLSLVLLSFISENEDGIHLDMGRFTMTSIKSSNILVDTDNSNLAGSDL